ncbi:NACHT, LRR and PYD domains-containing protein 12-like [Lethenteron reissneri]|uniref:NACHT, LRR and PYD domains-containing protein 12-like n=1 Tax=Lethenteron reissneri TaxID=7753 RepID=UPI002AB7AE51|nr:NACHT, LRR and PYD domains-containing protein 12-like [Lethenteron reissneri]
MASNAGPSWKVIKKHRVYLEEHLYPFAPDVLSRSDQDDIIRRREYAQLRSDTDPVGQIRRLIDLVLDKGEDTCSQFLQEVLLPLRSRIPQLSEWVSRHQEDLRGLGLTLGKDGDSGVPGVALGKHLERYRTYMKRETSFIQDYLPGETIFIPERFVQPVLVCYHRRGERKRHEFLDRACEHETMMQEAISNGMTFLQLFDPMESNGEPPRLVAVVGVPGIGKSTLSKLVVYRLVTDGNIFDRRFKVVIYIPFREMSDIGEVSLAELLRTLNPSLGEMANYVFEKPEEVLFVMDGLDEFGRHLDFSKACNDPRERTNLEALIAGLVTGKLLAGSSVLITTRPIAMEKLDAVRVDRSVEITGFSVEERKSFFCKFYKDPILGERAYQLLEKNATLSDLCYNPSFCHMSAITIGDLIKRPGNSEFALRSTTDLFTRYLFVLIKHHTGDSTETSKIIASLSKMALEGVHDNMQIFTRAHLQKFEVTIAEGSSTFINKVFRWDGIRRDTLYSFSHLTIQEYLAALAVYLEQPKRGFFAPVSELIWPSKHSVARVIKAIEDDKDGRYDVFQRFLCGLATDAPWKILDGIVDPPSVESQTAINEWITLHNRTTRNQNGHRLLSLLHRLHELQDPGALSEATGSMAALDLSYTRLSSLDCAALCWTLQFRDEPVHRLNLQSCGIGTEDMKRLQPALHRCKVLRLSGNSLTEGIQLLADGMVGREGNLETLDLDCCSLTDKSSSSLRNILEANAKLKKLRLSGNNLTDIIQLLVDGMAGREGRLEMLYLDRCSLTDKSIVGLHDIISTNRALWWLGVRGNGFSEEGKMELKGKWAHRGDLTISFNYL